MQRKQQLNDTGGESQVDETAQCVPFSEVPSPCPWVHNYRHNSGEIRAERRGAKLRVMFRPLPYGGRKQEVMKVLTNAEDIVQGARDDRYSGFTAAQLLDDLTEVEALRARLAELEAVAQEMGDRLESYKEVTLTHDFDENGYLLGGAHKDLIFGFFDEVALVRYKAYKSKHTAADEADNT